MRTDAPIEAEHPLRRLGVPLAEIAAKSGVKRENLSFVLHRHRHRVGYDANERIKAAFPEYAAQEAMDWRWPRLKLFASQRSSRQRKQARSTS